MDAEFCRHLPHKTTNEFRLQCDCGLVSQQHCCECRKLVDTTKITECFKCCSCELIICNRCILDCTRKSKAARCDKCAKANAFRFEAKLWCVVMRMFFVDNLNNVRVDNHIIKTLFRSTKDAIAAVPVVLQALHPNSELVNQLVESTQFPLIIETQTKETFFSTDNFFVKGFQLRVEIQVKLMISDAEEEALPSQMKTS